MSVRQYPDPHLRYPPRPVGDDAPRSVRHAGVLAAAVLVVLLAAGALTNLLSAEDNPHPGAPVSFAVGQDVQVQNFRVHLHGARLAEALSDDDTELSTAGVWLILDLSYASVRRPEMLSDIGVRDGAGRTYRISPRAGYGTWQAAPDLWRRGEVAFEIPRDAGSDFTVFIWPGGRSEAESFPMPYGVSELSVDPDAIEAGPVELAPAELLPAGQR